MGNNGQPSLTARTAAAARAAHLAVDRPPWIFSDDLAATLLGAESDELIGYHRGHPRHPVLAAARTQVTCRSRYTEDCLAAALARGVTQYVILGAGLDSFGYRGVLAGGLRVFEVDHPVTQRWKRQRLAAAGIAVPGRLSYVPADLEAPDLGARLAQAGFDRSAPALVSWLGVTMYLSLAAIGRALAQLAQFAPGTELITDYMLPAGRRDPAGDAYVEQVAPVSAGGGEPWLTFLAPEELSALLEHSGFAAPRHLRQRELVDPALWRRADALGPVELSMLAHAIVRPPGWPSPRSHPGASSGCG
jgi:methyltransferase (TIGR00027 family)